MLFLTKRANLYEGNSTFAKFIGLYEKKKKKKNQGLEPVLGISFGTLKNPRFCGVPGTGSGWNPKFKKSSRIGSWEP
jgi:hypothetical protein